MTDHDPTDPSLAKIKSLAHDALSDMPERFRRELKDLVIQVVDFPDEETMAAMGLHTRYDLLGLYHGVPLGEKSITQFPGEMDVIQLYRRPLLDYWLQSGEDLEHLVRHVLFHEIGHHFGFSDDDMEAIEDQAE